MFNMEEQLLLFQDPIEDIMKRDISILKDKYESIRKGQHARISMLQKEVKELRSELEFLKSHICKTRLF